MTTKEKLEKITSEMEDLNNAVFKNTRWHIEFKNKGANNYCILIKIDKSRKEYFSAKFNTYDGVLNALALIKQMFSKELNNDK